MKEKKYSVLQTFSHPKEYVDNHYPHLSDLFLEMITPLKHKLTFLHPKTKELYEETIPFIQNNCHFQSKNYIERIDRTTHPIYTPHVIFDNKDTIIILPIRFDEYVKNDEPVQLSDTIIFILSVLHYEMKIGTTLDTYNIAESYAAQTLIDHGLENVKMNKWRERVLSHYQYGLESFKKT